MKTGRNHLVKYYFFILFLCFGCNNGKKKEIDGDVIKLEIHVSEKELFDLSNCAEITAIVPLETTEHSLIKRIDKIYTTESSFIIFDKAMNTILLFSRDGHFLRQIGAKGPGPTEYKIFNDIYFDNKDEIIYAHERLNKHIYVYNLNGDLLDKKHSNYMFNSFCVTEEGYWIYSCFNNDIENPNGYALRLLDKNDLNKVIANHLPQNMFYPTTHETRFFKDANDNLLFVYPFSDFVYLLEGTNARPYYQFDFKEKSLPYIHIRESKNENYFNELEEKNKYVGGISNMVFSKDAISFTFTNLSRESLTYFAWYDKKAKQTNVYGGFKTFKGLVFDNTTFESLVLTQPISFDGDHMIFKIEVDPLFEKDFSLLKEKMKDIELDANPLLFFVKMAK